MALVTTSGIPSPISLEATLGSDCGWDSLGRFVRGY